MAGIPRSREALVAAFWAWVQKGDGCWTWTGPATPKGYGTIGSACLGAHHTYAHRLSWLLHNGQVPDGLNVCHHCDNPRCVNPAHLFLGTAQDNNRDKSRKGRAPHGEGHPNAKFTETLVREIRSRVRSGERIKAVARSLGRPYLSVYYVAKGLRWGHVTEAA